MVEKGWYALVMVGKTVLAINTHYSYTSVGSDVIISVILQYAEQSFIPRLVSLLRAYRRQATCLDFMEKCKYTFYSYGRKKWSCGDEKVLTNNFSVVYVENH